MPELAAALRARSREIGLVLEEITQRVPAREAERDPVSEGLSALLLDPVPLRLGHRRPL
jgi:hypothetical protein